MHNETKNTIILLTNGTYITVHPCIVFIWIIWKPFTLCQTQCIKMDATWVLIFAPCAQWYVMQIVQILLVMIRSASAENGVEIKIRPRRVVYWWL